MKRFAPVIIAAILIAGGIWYGRQPVANPDPSHTHADFAIWINKEQLDLSGPQFMSEAYDPNGKQMRVDPMRKYLHLHDGVGHVAHRHKPSLTFGEFLQSLGFVKGRDIHPDFNPPGEADYVILPDGTRLWDELQNWRVVINGSSIGCKRENFPANCPEMETYPEDATSDIDLLWDYEFQDGDKILMTYEYVWNRDEVKRQYQLVTNDACRYSQTCPWRGPAPTENCIADPEVPCVAP